MSRYLAKTFFDDHFVGALGRERVALQELGKHVSVANRPARSCKILISFFVKKGRKFFRKKMNIILKLISLDYLYCWELS